MEPEDRSNDNNSVTILWTVDITFVLFRITPFEWDDNGEGEATNQWTISNALWFGIGSFLCQGCDILPK